MVFKYNTMLEPATQTHISKWLEKDELGLSVDHTCPYTAVRETWWRFVARHSPIMPEWSDEKDFQVEMARVVAVSPNCPVYREASGCNGTYNGKLERVARNCATNHWFQPGYLEAPWKFCKSERAAVKARLDDLKSSGRRVENTGVKHSDTEIWKEYLEETCCHVWPPEDSSNIEGAEISAL